MEDSGEIWEHSALRRIEGMKMTHRQQRARLEADIESRPGKACYSEQLMGLMQREQAVIAEGGKAAALEARVEAMLAGETKRVLKFQAQRNHQRWVILFERQREGREKLAKQLSREVASQNPATAGTTATHGGGETLQGLRNGGIFNGTRTDPSAYEKTATQHPQHPQKLQNDQRKLWRHQSQGDMSLSSTQFEKREANMRAASAARWAEDECFSLENAFGLQLKRLEVDWNAHEGKLEAEYEARRAALEARLDTHVISSRGNFAGAGKAQRPCPPPGKRTDSKGNGDGADEHDLHAGADNPWRDREKQSRLIHTAPVFQPDTGRRAAPSSSTSSRRASGDRAVNGGVGARPNGDGIWVRAAERELERLDAAFSAVTGDVKSQKIAAQKWIRRQRIRMEAQIEAMAEERTNRQERLNSAGREEDELLRMVTTSWRPQK